MSGGTINIHYNDLAGDTLNAASPPNTNFLTPANYNINLQGDATLNLGQPDRGVLYDNYNFNITVSGHNNTINGGAEGNFVIEVPDKDELKITGKLIGANYAPSEQMSFLGAGRIVNDGTVTMGNAAINPDISGKGELVVQSGRDWPADVTINGAIGQDQTLSFQGQVGDAVNVNAAFFKATVDFNAAPVSVFEDSLSLGGIHATSYDIKDDILTLYNGHRPVDRLHVVNNTSGALSVDLGQSSVSIILHPATTSG
jgi:hypothetical protein